MSNTIRYDVIVIGAGAAGLMCAATAAQRGRRVLLLDHAQKIGEKIRISGGGRCNFTNMHASPAQFLSNNPHFCKSALKQYTQHDFIALVKKYGIAYHEKALGQLFCDGSSQQIIDMLLTECSDAAVELRISTTVDLITYEDGLYQLSTDAGDCYEAESLVVATGGLSIPKIGASKFGYDIARHFDINVIETRAGLVPLTFQAALLEWCKGLSGVSVDSSVTAGGMSFDEAMLFTHRGLSGPSILQISSYWSEGEDIILNLAKGVDVFSVLVERKTSSPKQDIQTVLSDIIPKRLAQSVLDDLGVEGRIADLPHKALEDVASIVNACAIRPSGTEGYRTAEVTLGGVDTDALSSKTMEAKQQPGLYFIGEVVDVTGWLGGYNFQWAWSSGVACGRVA